MCRGMKELDKIKAHFTFNALLVAPMSNAVVGMRSRVWRTLKCSEDPRPGDSLLSLPVESAVPVGFIRESLSSWRQAILHGL